MSNNSNGPPSIGDLPVAGDIISMWGETGRLVEDRRGLCTCGCHKSHSSSRRELVRRRQWRKTPSPRVGTRTHQCLSKWSMGIRPGSNHYKYTNYQWLVLRSPATTSMTWTAVSPTAKSQGDTELLGAPAQDRVPASPWVTRSTLSAIAVGRSSTPSAAAPGQLCRALTRARHRTSSTPFHVRVVTTVSLLALPRAWPRERNETDNRVVAELQMDNGRARAKACQHRWDPQRCLMCDDYILHCRRNLYCRRRQLYAHRDIRWKGLVGG